MSQKQHMEHAVEPLPSSRVSEQAADPTQHYTNIPLPSYLSKPHQTIDTLNSDAINYIYDSSDINPGYTDDATAYFKSRRLSLLLTTMSLLSRPKLPGDLIAWKRSKIEWSLERLLGRVRLDFSLQRVMPNEHSRTMAQVRKVIKERQET